MRMQKYESGGWQSGNSELEDSGQEGKLLRSNGSLISLNYYGRR